MIVNYLRNRGVSFYQNKGSPVIGPHGVVAGSCLSDNHGLRLRYATSHSGHPGLDLAGEILHRQKRRNVTPTIPMAPHPCIDSFEKKEGDCSSHCRI